MRVAVVVFPGTNCDVDCIEAWRTVLACEAMPCWHRDRLPANTDLVILPGGFSHGDYLRCGALAALSPIMADIAEHSLAGGLVLGICNGFQILCEAGLLPGVLRRNASGRFICRNVGLTVARCDTAFTSQCPARIRLPIAHGEGAYWADPATLARIEANGQVLFRYEEPNPNGSLNNIAGIMNEAGNVAGLMPHPERAWGELLANRDGESLIRSTASMVRA